MHLTILISCQPLESVMLLDDLVHILSTQLVLTLHVKILFYYQGSKHTLR